jgi:hypothetical protein
MTRFSRSLMRARAALTAGTVASVALLGVGATTPVAHAQTAGFASTTGTAARWTADKLPLGSGLTEDVALPTANTIGCLSSGECVTAVTFNGTYGGELVVGSGSSWRAIVPPAPSNAASGPGGADEQFAAAACGGRRCVAVGNYYASSGSGLLAETGKGTSWTPYELPDRTGEAALARVACADECAAISANSVYFRAELELGSGTSWKATVAPTPSNASSDPSVTLTTVACGGKTCVATGSYDTKSGGEDGLLEVTTGGAWKAVSVALPGMKAAEQDVALPDVSCVSSGACTAVGVSEGDIPGSAFITGSGTHWTMAKIPLPRGSSLLPSYGVYVACATATTCTAVSEYVGRGDFARGVIAVKSGKAVKLAALPAPGKGLVLVAPIACLSARRCAFAGTYEAESGSDRPMLVTGAGTKWKASELPVPKGAPKDLATEPVWLACPHACDIVGIYDGEVPYLSAGPA